MRKETKKSINQYYGLLKALFPHISFNEGRFLRDYRMELIEYCKRHPSCTYEGLIKEFGYPEDILHEYISNQKTEYLLLSLKRKNVWKISLAIVLIATIICVTSFMFALYKSYSLSADAVTNTSTIENNLIEKITGDNYE